jgi:hypothetical protein
MMSYKIFKKVILFMVDSIEDEDGSLVSTADAESTSIESVIVFPQFG